MRAPKFQFEVQKGPEDRNKDVEFEAIPVDAFCPHCRKTVVTTVELHSSWLTWVWVTLLFLFLGTVSFCVFPFVWRLLKDSVHYCSQCNNLLAQKHRLRCPVVKNEVVTARCGGCAIVLSYGWALVLLLMCGLIGVAYMGRYYIKYVGIPDIPRGPDIDTTWEEYLNQCGVRSYLGNPLHANYAYEHQFKHKTVLWNGRMMRVSEGILSKHFMYLRMDPPQYPGPMGLDRPDMGLIFDKKMSDDVAQVDVGDRIQFSSTLITLAKRGQPHFGVMWDFKVLEKADALPPLEPDRGFFYMGNMGVAHMARKGLDYYSGDKPERKKARVVADHNKHNHHHNLDHMTERRRRHADHNEHAEPNANESSDERRIAGDPSSDRKNPSRTADDPVVDDARKNEDKAFGNVQAAAVNGSVAVEKDFGVRENVLQEEDPLKASAPAA